MAREHLRLVAVARRAHERARRAARAWTRPTRRRSVTQSPTDGQVGGGSPRRGAGARQVAGRVPASGDELERGAVNERDAGEREPAAERGERRSSWTGVRPAAARGEAIGCSLDSDV